MLAAAVRFRVDEFFFGTATSPVHRLDFTLRRRELCTSPRGGAFYRALATACSNRFLPKLCSVRGTRRWDGILFRGNVVSRGQPRTAEFNEVATKKCTLKCTHRWLASAGSFPSRYERVRDQTSVPPRGKK